MKLRTGIQRADRKEKKAMELKEKNAKKQLHVLYKNNPGYNQIIQSVKQKTSHLVLSNAHFGAGIKRKVLAARTLWNNGTYIRGVHGKLKSAG